MDDKKNKNVTKHTWKLWLFAGVCFLLCAVLNISDKKYILAILYFLLTIIYIVLSRKSYKQFKKTRNLRYTFKSY